MPLDATVLVLDAASPRDFLDALRTVVRTTAPDVDVVGVSHRFPKVDAKLARRVRRVRVRLASDAQAAAGDVATTLPGHLVVVLGSDCVLSSSWWADVQQIALARPTTASDAGGDGTHVRIYPPGVVPHPGLDDAAAALRPVTISASLIVKDEEEKLAACLEAVAPFVDEVVVYDTGSSDRTVQIAREAGAVVVEGYWNDHFGDARNRSLEHCTGDWVVHVDADEVAQGDPVALRELLQHSPADMVRVPILSTSWSGASDGVETRPARIFRRATCTWRDALHEYLDARYPGRPLYTESRVAPLTLLHSGYHATTVHEKDKHARNLEIARAAALAVDPAEPGADMAWSHYGRSLTAAGRPDEALEAFAQVLDHGSNPTAVVPAGRVAVGLLTARERFAEVPAWWVKLAAHGEAAGNVTRSKAEVALARGDVDAAQAHLDAVEPGADLWGVAVDTTAAAILRTKVQQALGEHDHALEGLVRLSHDRPEAVPLDLLVGHAGRAGTPLLEVVRRCHPTLVERSLRDAMHLPVASASDWLTALHEHAPADPAPVLAGSIAAARGPLVTALTWAATARAAGMPQFCALRRYAEDDRRPAGDRALAWALLGDAFGESDAPAAFDRVVPELDAGALDRLREHLSSFAPAYLPRAGAGALA